MRTLNEQLGHDQELIGRGIAAVDSNDLPATNVEAIRKVLGTGLAKSGFLDANLRRELEDALPKINSTPKVSTVH